MTALFDRVYGEVSPRPPLPTVARECPDHGEYEAIEHDPDQSCPRPFCERVGETL